MPEISHTTRIIELLSYKLTCFTLRRIFVSLRMQEELTGCKLTLRIQTAVQDGPGGIKCSKYN